MTNNRSDYSFISFVKEIPKYFVNPNEKYIKWGLDNKTPFKYLELYYTVPEHTSALDFIETLIIGEGISTDTLSYWEAKKLVFDYILFGGYTIQVAKQKNGNNLLSYVDISNCRLSVDKKKVAYSDNWNAYKPEIIWLPLTTSIKEEGIFYFKTNKSRTDYPTPYYISAEVPLNTMKSINMYHANNADNGFSPNIVINFNGGNQDEETKRKIEQGIKDKFTGGAAQKFILSFN